LNPKRSTWPSGSVMREMELASASISNATSRDAPPPGTPMRASCEYGPP
jgi:hypothetical protein